MLVNVSKGFVIRKEAMFKFFLTLFFIVDIITHVLISPHLFANLPPAPDPLPSGLHHTVVCVYGLCIYVLADPFTSFHTVLPFPSTLTDAGLLKRLSSNLDFATA